ncbi:MAG TPA: dihydroorotate dehydrogenase electron transfer subunit [Firmicutes bacterium]|nr:dihydroorotate dehydrogenase electron transfer subunit [Bacillota bacterium]
MQVVAPVISNVEIAPSIFRMSLSAPGIARSALPGQFVHVVCHDAGNHVSEGSRNSGLSLDPLLRRPFSICRVDRSGATIDLVYQVVGRGTEMLSRVAPGEAGRAGAVDILGPLGRGFDIPRSLAGEDAAGRALLVAGGLGVAPLIFLAYALAERQVRADVAVGARSRDLLWGIDEFELLGFGVELATEDGSAGARGLVTELVERRLCESLGGHGAPTVRYAAIFACGPAPMLAAVARLAGERGVPCQVSLEERMACGVGACLGCVVKTKAGYRRVCADGPVFNAADIFFDSDGLDFDPGASDAGVLHEAGMPDEARLSDR